MDAQIIVSLIALGLTIIGALGTVVKALTDRIVTDLKRNTLLTSQTLDETRQQNQEMHEQLAVLRNRVVALREIVRERDDRIAYIESRIPQAEEVLAGYKNRRQIRHSETEEHVALRRMLSNVDDSLS